MVRFDGTHLSQDCLQPIYADKWRYRYNFDGILSYCLTPDNKWFYSYLQVFRNGSIEAVDADLLSEQNGKCLFRSVGYEEEQLKAMPKFLSIQKQLGVEPPLLIMLSLLEVSGYIMAVNERRFWALARHPVPIDRDALLLSEILVERYDCDPAEIMRPVFDAVWNACGWPRSINYNQGGKWVGH